MLGLCWADVERTSDSRAHIPRTPVKEVLLNAQCTRVVEVMLGPCLGLFLLCDSQCLNIVYFFLGDHPLNKILGQWGLL